MVLTASEREVEQPSAKNKSLIKAVGNMEGALPRQIAYPSNLQQKNRKCKKTKYI
jgi:hypothetical protein